MAALKAGAQVVRPKLPAVTPESPRGPIAVNAEFRWHADFQATAWRVVLLSDNRQELVWSPPQRGMTYRPEGDFRAALQRGGCYYWYAVGSKGGSDVRSEITPIATPIEAR
jgi:hypothetical protein